GKEYADTLLRQSVRFCVDEERGIHRSKNSGEEALRALLPKLLDRHGLASRSPGDRRPDDAWTERMSQLIYASRRDQAAEAVAEALAEGIAPEALLPEAEAAIKAKDQARACALVHRYGELGRPARPVFDLLLRYAISEDGALHAEKYYRTVTEEFAATREAFRWRQLAALARVTASEFGFPAAGYAEACKLLKV